MVDSKVAISTKKGAGKLNAKMAIALGSYTNEPVTVRIDDTDTQPIAARDEAVAAGLEIARVAHTVLIEIVLGRVCPSAGHGAPVTVRRPRSRAASMPRPTEEKRRSRGAASGAARAHARRSAAPI